MKILQILIFVLSFVVIANAQVDCAVTNKIIIKDYDGNSVKNVKVELLKVRKSFNRESIYNLQINENNEFIIKTFTARVLTGTKETHYVGENYRIRVSANGFKQSELPVKFKRCEGQTLSIILEKDTQAIKLKGTIYDTNGALVVAVNIFAKNSKGEIFVTKSIGIEKKYRTI